MGDLIADAVLGFGYVCGGAWFVLIGILAYGAIRGARHHRRLHAALGLPASGVFTTCATCIDDAEIKYLPWTTRFARDQLRKRLRREEFDDHGPT